MTSLPGVSGATDRSAAWLIMVACAMLMAFYYVARTDTIGVTSLTRDWAPMTGKVVPAWIHFASSALLLGVLPVLVARRVTGLSLTQLGLGLGNWRAGLLLLVVGIPIAVLAGLVAAETPALHSVYPLDPVDAPARFATYALMQFLYFGAWEVLFRGVLLFGLSGKIGVTNANAVQSALSVTAHFGRALSETASALPAGLVLGAVTIRVGSIWPVAIIHWVIGVSKDWFIIT